MLLKDYVNSAREALSEIYPPEEANALVGVLCTEFLGVQSYTYIVNPGLEIKTKVQEKADAALSRLRAGEPIQYVLGFTEFCGNSFKVNPAVLIPRPETETLCKVAIEAAMIVYRSRSVYGAKARPVRILDLCTGSGCIAWTLALNVPGSEVTAVDISAEALKVAASQPLNPGKGKAPRFVQADIFNDAALAEAIGISQDDGNGFDIIVSNPPYVLDSEKRDMRINVLEHEPSIALFVPDNDCMRFNAKLSEICARLLHPDSFGIVEINDKLADEAMAVFAGAGLRKCETVKDIFGRRRFVRFIK